MKIIRVGNESLDLPNEFSNRIYDLRFNKCIPHTYNSSKSVSIKFITRGAGIYIIDGKEFLVEPDKFLIMGYNREVVSFLDLKSGETNALSVFLEEEYIQEVFYSIKNSHKELLEAPVAEKEDIEFHENIFNINNDSLSKVLMNLKLSIYNGSVISPDDLFFDLASCLLITQVQIKRQMGNLNALKRSTKIELYRRLQMAVNMIEDMDGRIELSSLSREVGLSQFHLLRSFKQAYGVSPYRFAIQVRMKKAVGFLLKTENSINHIALLLGFNDVHSFSKAFKRETGYPPSKFRSEFN